MEASPGERAPQATASLTYYGGLRAHLDHVYPLLAARDLRATFYPAPTTLFNDPKAWQEVAEWHEIGNAAFQGVSVNGDLPSWTLQMVKDDLSETEKLLRELFPAQAARSFAYPGPSANCLQSLEERVEVSYEPVIRNTFSAAVLLVRGVNAYSGLDPLRVRTIYVADADETLSFAEQALREKAWIVFRMDDLAGPAELAHTRLCEWLSQKRAVMPTRPVIEVAQELLKPAVPKR